ncbi:hypothetical protein HDC95_002450 [Microbacterium sp. AK031]|nr:hypothetical protein [Microbacterium sp. AK031]
MVGGYTRQLVEGEASQMSGKAPQARGGKKVAQTSLKEKRAAKRAKQEPQSFIKPRKGANG